MGGGMGGNNARWRIQLTDFEKHIETHFDLLAVLFSGWPLVMEASEWRQGDLGGNYYLSNTSGTPPTPAMETPLHSHFRNRSHNKTRVSDCLCTMYIHVWEYRVNLDSEEFCVVAMQNWDWNGLKIHSWMSNYRFFCKRGQQTCIHIA